METAVLTMQDVSIRFPGKPAYEHINFRVNEGEHCVLTGDNIPMIRTFMDAINGKSIVSKGKITYNFPDRIKSSDGRTAFSPYPFISTLPFSTTFKSVTGVNNSYYQQRYNSADSENSRTVGDYLSGIRPVSGDHQWTQDKVADALHIGGLLDEHLIRLSNGETKKVLLAAAILRNPRILLLENPFIGIDVKTRGEISGLINAISASGVTVIMTASGNEIPECITHVVVFSGNNRLETFSRNEFHTQQARQTKEVDRELLSSLLSRTTMPTFDTMVQMNHVTVRYAGNLILNDINWTIKQGERWSLSGPNGAGKTTLLSLINGDNPQAFANDIVLFDRRKGSGESIWDIKQKIGFFSAELFQFFPAENTCLAAVESGFYDTMGLFRPSLPRTSSIAAKWLQLMHLEHLANKPLRNIQPVEKRLCLLARALVKNPVLLILDEPGQGMNQPEKDFFKNLIDLICLQTNTTLIYVSHYEDEIPGSVTRFLRLEKP